MDELRLVDEDPKEPEISSINLDKMDIKTFKKVKRDALINLLIYGFLIPASIFAGLMLFPAKGAEMIAIIVGFIIAILYLDQWASIYKTISNHTNYDMYKHFLSFLKTLAFLIIFCLFSAFLSRKIDVFAIIFTAMVPILCFYMLYRYFMTILELFKSSKEIFFLIHLLLFVSGIVLEILGYISLFSLRFSMPIFLLEASSIATILSFPAVIIAWIKVKNFYKLKF